MSFTKSSSQYTSLGWVLSQILLDGCHIGVLGALIKLLELDILIRRRF